MFLFNSFLLSAKIVRQYKMTIIPYGMWPRLVTRLLSFPRRAIQVLLNCMYQFIHMIICCPSWSCDSQMTEPVRQMYWYCGVYSFWSMVGEESITNTTIVVFVMVALAVEYCLSCRFWYSLISPVYNWQSAYFLIEQLEKSKHVINITVPKTALGIRWVFY